MALMGHAKIGAKDQVTIPKNVREALGGLEPGQYLLFFQEGKNIFIRKGKVGLFE